MATEKPSTDTPTFDQQVNDAASKMVENDKGVWELPAEALESVSTEVAYAAKLEKRFRDTQGAYTKATKKNKELETVNGRLESHLIESATNHLTEDQRNELDELKMRDPDSWREKLNEHEQTAKKLLQDKIADYRKEGHELSELERRKIQLADFSERNNIKLDDDVIENSLPASYSKQLADGKITFEEFLGKAQKFLTADKVIKGADDKDGDNKPNLGNLPGGAKPSEQAVGKDIITSYKGEIY